MRRSDFSPLTSGGSGGGFSRTGLSPATVLFAAVAVALLLVPAGCSLVASRPFDLSQINDPEGIRLVKLNHVGQKERWDCGAGALAMVYNYWGDPVGRDQIVADLLKESGKKGSAISAAALKKHALERGYYAFIYRTDLDDILKQIAKGRPVIVCRKVLWGVNHYEVVFGYDAKRKEVLIDDPAVGQVRRSESAFRRQHKRTGGFTLLVVPKRKGGK